MNVLIIGSGGFIGQNLSSFLTPKESFSIWKCDILNVQNDANYFHIDPTFPDFNAIFRQQQFDFCINCSGAASVPDSLKDPMRDFQLNTVNVFKILDAIRTYQPNCKFLNLSSAAVYGNPQSLPVSELHHTQPVSPYGVHKLQAEQICDSFYQHFGIGTCNLRIFSAYGPGLKKQLFWDLYQKAQKSNHVELFGTGEETRDFIFIEDILQAILLVIEKALFKGKQINIANGKQWSIKDAVYAFYNAIEWDGNAHFIGENRKGDPLNWEADISLLRELDYRQQYDLSEGLTKYAAWLKEEQ